MVGRAQMGALALALALSQGEARLSAAPPRRQTLPEPRKPRMPDKLPAAQGTPSLDPEEPDGAVVATSIADSTSASPLARDSSARRRAALQAGATGRTLWSGGGSQPEAGPRIPAWSPDRGAPGDWTSHSRYEIRRGR
jgi:hypothetical protein